MQSIVFSEIVFNFILLGIDAVAVVAVWANRSVFSCAAGLGLVVVASVFAGYVISDEMFLWMRLVAWGLFAHLPSLAIILGALVWRTRALSIALFFVALVTIGIAVDAFLIEPHQLELTFHRVVSDKVDAALRIVVISDVQTDRFGAYERDALRLATEQEADLILLAGDYIQTRQTDLWLRLRDEMRAYLNEINFTAPLGVYAVGGNSDWFRWTTIFENTPVTICNRTGEFAIQRAIYLTCLSVRDSFDADLTIAPQPGLHIVLGHAPNFALGDVEADLLIAGHTHGGQVRLPLIGPLMTSSRVPSSWAANLTEIENGKYLFVSRGIGMERLAAPRLRFLCRPELAILDVVPPSE